MNFCSIVSQASKPNIKTVLNTICLFFIFFVSTNTVGAIASPDLIIQTIATDKTTLDPGESFEIQARLWNRGTAVSGATTLRYCLSTDDTISTADTEVGSDPVECPLRQGCICGAPKSRSLANPHRTRYTRCSLLRRLYRRTHG